MRRFLTLESTHLFITLGQLTFFFFYFSSLLSAAAFHCIFAGIRAESLISAVLALELFGLGV